jgi:hypothetical protein
MKSNSGIAVICRENLLKRLWPANRPASLEISKDDIRSRYRGIEGEAWPREPDFADFHVTDGLAPKHRFRECLHYYNRVKECHANCSLLYLVDCPERRPAANVDLPGFFPRGYDFGYYLSESNLFSAVMSEIIYGSYEELARYSTLLNEWLLLPNLEIAVAYGRSRSSILRSGANLESDEPCLPIATYEYATELA